MYQAWFWQPAHDFYKWSSEPHCDLHSLKVTPFTFFMTKLNANWINGFLSRPECFVVYVTKQKGRKRCSFQPALFVQVDGDDFDLAYAFHKYFKCGNVYTGSPVEWRVDKLEDLLEHVIPFFEKHPFKTEQQRVYFDYFRSLCIKLDKEEHLTKKGYDECFGLAIRLYIRAPKGALVFKAADEEATGEIDASDEKTMALIRQLMPKPSEEVNEDDYVQMDDAIKAVDPLAALLSEPQSQSDGDTPKGNDDHTESSTTDKSRSREP